ncbi:MAG TPA: serine/threonine-protein kinase [Pirellulales bacterium]|nr:serine/threonine-protein kinase [Pirellulales bacterium]
MDFDKFNAARIAATGRPGAACAPFRKMPVPGMTLVDGRYALKRRLGRGGMGDVWLAADSFATVSDGPESEGDVALKFLPPELSAIPEEMNVFRQSVARLRSIRGTFLCPLYDIQCDQQVGFFISMKYVQGQTLAEYRKQKQPLQLEEVIQIIEWTAIGLDDLHCQGVVHRDVKPENVMLVQLSPRERIPLQVVDYSVAGEIRESAARLSANVGFQGGTCLYMSPEQWAGKPAGAAADQYGLACVAYFLLTGSPPFVGDPGILKLCHESTVPDDISGIAPAVNRVLKTALAKKPIDRYKTCGEFAAQLKLAHLTPESQSFLANASGHQASAKPALVIPRRGARSVNDTLHGDATLSIKKAVIPPRPGASRPSSHAVDSLPPNAGDSSGISTASNVNEPWVPPVLELAPVPSGNVASRITAAIEEVGKAAVGQLRKFWRQWFARAR